MRLGRRRSTSTSSSKANFGSCAVTRCRNGPLSFRRDRLGDALHVGVEVSVSRPQRMLVVPAERRRSAARWATVGRGVAAAVAAAAAPGHGERGEQERDQQGRQRNLQPHRRSNLASRWCSARQSCWRCWPGVPAAATAATVHVLVPDGRAVVRQDRHLPPADPPALRRADGSARAPPRATRRSRARRPSRRAAAPARRGGDRPADLRRGPRRRRRRARRCASCTGRRAGRAQAA